MNDHITKPINVSHMLTTMAEWISPKHLLEEEASLTKKTDNKESNEKQRNVIQKLSRIEGIKPELSPLDSKPDLLFRLLPKFHDKQTHF